MVSYEWLSSTFTCTLCFFPSTHSWSYQSCGICLETFSGANIDGDQSICINSCKNSYLLKHKNPLFFFFFITILHFHFSKHPMSNYLFYFILIIKIFIFVDFFNCLSFIAYSNHHYYLPSISPITIFLQPQHK